MENQMKQISAAFVKAQKAFNPALKSSINPHFKSRYVGLDGCVEAVIDALNDNGIALIQETSECNDGVIIETVFIHESGEVMRCGKLHVPATKQDAQGYGSALTYARRYSLMAACGIAPEDDDGNHASKKEVKKDFSEEVSVLRSCTTIKSLAKAWELLDKQTQHALLSVKDECKDKIQNIGDISQ